MTKLTPDQVAEIERLYSVRRPTTRELAKRFGVSHTTIRRVLFPSLRASLDAGRKKP